MPPHDESSPKVSPCQRLRSSVDTERIYLTPVRPLGHLTFSSHSIEVAAPTPCVDNWNPHLPVTSIIPYWKNDRKFKCSCCWHPVPAHGCPLHLPCACCIRPHCWEENHTRQAREARL